MTDIEMIKVVQDYIFQEKGVRVTINQPSSLNDLMLLTKAYNVALQNLKN